MKDFLCGRSQIFFKFSYLFIGKICAFSATQNKTRRKNPKKMLRVVRSKMKACFYGINLQREPARGKALL
jgi:hypothetical protein